MHFANGGRKRMRELKQRITLVGLLLLAGCNSTDALTPQVDVGGGTMRSPPVTQRDLDQMSAENPPVANAQASPTAGSPGGSSQAGGAGTLEAQGAFKVAPGTKVVALVTLPGRKAATVRFVVK